MDEQKAREKKTKIQRFPGDFKNFQESEEKKNQIQL